MHTYTHTHIHIRRVRKREDKVHALYNYENSYQRDAFFYFQKKCKKNLFPLRLFNDIKQIYKSISFYFNLSLVYTSFYLQILLRTSVLKIVTMIYQYIYSNIGNAIILEIKSHDYLSEYY